MTRSAPKFSVNKRLSLLAALAVLGSSAAQATSVNGTINVNASDNIYASGTYASGQNSLLNYNGEGTAPSSISVSGSSYVTLSASGTITLNNYGGTNDPDGLSGGKPAYVDNSSHTGYESLSGISAPGAGYLVGVFVGPGGPSGTAPASLDYTNTGTMSESSTSYSPLLDQLFFVGDGLTGDGTGTTQQFYVPTGADRFYLGISDGCGFNGYPSCYADNQGTFTVNYDVVTAGNGLSTVPLPGTALLFGSGVIGLLGLGRKRIQRRAPVCAT